MIARFRHTQLDPAHEVVTTHCTIDSGEGTFQTAVTFRCGPKSADVLTVTRPDPQSTVAKNDRSSVSILFREGSA
ncbi:hypothetical protein NLU14_08735 [Marinobacter sp. 71-i]|uniref:Uncharacterized protein n=1 Tax=Marinobacter iranensis TaxID=2962607 RepID=A0ABT5Y9G0_9GAMM|nr:hypothetical protein [Marinobacter iranensis]MDF0750315.1 hypothetical protein [Marinobacter iranensis]